MRDTPDEQQPASRPAAVSAPGNSTAGIPAVPGPAAAQSAAPARVNTRPAERVAGTIGAVKWVLIAGYLLVALVVLIATIFGLSAADAPFMVMAGLSATGVLASGALVVWVTFGWLQHSLGMLVTIAQNTGKA